MAVPTYDVVIVGAGASGCVLAARLTERPGRRVLLLEAGPHYGSIEAFPPALTDAGDRSAQVPGHPNNWSFEGRLTPQRSFPLPRGKGVGGSSAINGSVFARGRPVDFAAWEALAGPEWSGSAVAPYFIAAETDVDFPDSADHGSAGPLRVSRTPRPLLHPVSAAFFRACLDLGVPEEPDKNAPGPPGVGLVPTTRVGGVRTNTALAYLFPALDRPGLTVVGDAHVRRIVVEGGRAVGVEYLHHGRCTVVAADEVVLCAGAIGTPHLLALSGIGPADELRRLGLAVVCDSPGVGATAADHPSVGVRYRVADTRAAAADVGHAGGIEVGCNLDSGYGLPEDVQIACFPTLLAAVGQGTDLVFNCSLERQASRGRVVPVSADPTERPAIDLHYLSEPGDLAPFRQCVRVAVALLETPAFRALGAVRVAPTDDDLASDTALDRWVAGTLATSFHTSCTARMGTDPAAVVDPHCAVRGVEGLRVVDLSVSPTLVCRPTYATAVMIAERAAAFFD